MKNTCREGIAVCTCIRCGCRFIWSVRKMKRAVFIHSLKLQLKRALQVGHRIDVARRGRGCYEISFVLTWSYVWKQSTNTRSSKAAGTSLRSSNARVMPVYLHLSKSSSSNSTAVLLPSFKSFKNYKRSTAFQLSKWLSTFLLIRSFH